MKNRAGSFGRFLESGNHVKLLLLNLGLDASVTTEGRWQHVDMTKGTVNDLLSCMAEALVAKPIHLFIIRHGGIGSGSFHSRCPDKNIDMILLQQRDDKAILM